MLASRIGALVAAVMAIGSARPAAAQTKPIVVIWQAPPDCPTADRVETEVEANLVRSGAVMVPVVAMVSVRGPTAGRWQASLLFQAGYTRAERNFEAESCEAIASAAALIITLWVEGGPVTPPPAAVARDSESPTAIAPGVAPRRTPFVLMLNGLLDRGTMPDPPAGGMEAAGGPTWMVSGWHLRALAGVSFFPNRRTPLMNPVEQADFLQLDFSARGCLTLVSNRFELGPCAGAELAVMHGSGTELQDSTQHWFSLLASAVAAWSISPAVAVFVRPELLIPTGRRTFLDPAGNTVYKVPTVAVRGALGLELRFW